MALTLIDFRVRFPEYENTPDALVQVNLDQAYRRTPANVWGCFLDDGAAWLAAHLLALSPMARDMRLVQADGTTLYKRNRDRLAQIVASGNRVAGLPPGLVAANNAAVPSCD